MFYLERNFIKSIFGGVIVLLIAIFVLSGTFTVKTGDEAIVLRFGKHVSTHVNAGLKWHIPIIEKVYKVNISEVKRLEFGFRTTSEGNSKEKPQFQDKVDESLILTGDENLVNAETIVQYKNKNAEDFYFNVDDPIGTLTIILESIIRRCIATHPIDEVLTDNKFGVQQEIKDALQQIADKYKLGIEITAIQLQDVNLPKEVDAAFKDVASAREGKTK